MFSAIAPADSGCFVIDDDKGVIRTRTDWLARINHPLHTPPWETGPITDSEIRTLVDAGQFTHPGHASQFACDPWNRTICRTCDLTRIAYLVANGWPTGLADPHPISVDLGVGGFIPQWVIEDGNHRLAAALVRGDTHIDVSAAGDWDRCLAVLVEGIPLWDLT